ncbi:DUF4234 domain-containing protein [Glaciibacter psychrotolerans]|uniref:DUF4234 domain-containing protein n=1 Tax=Glaciibacter psychrotolerans TaxID=670054 RepID=A0A7Z0EFB6_9MICO|nr:DUF4234 domain-containing protein [Leifsonia psychrotolerans]NYJ20559.1 hypothetical protein [Leifsonia psychrotolerans]
MKRRSPAAVLLVPLITFGIYSLVWFVKTKNEMNQTNVDRIPTAWLLLVPFVNIWWQWKFSVSVDVVTHKLLSRSNAFLLIFLLGPIGAAIVQNYLNEAIYLASRPRRSTALPVPMSA